MHIACGHWETWCTGRALRWPRHFCRSSPSSLPPPEPPRRIAQWALRPHGTPRPIVARLLSAPTSQYCAAVRRWQQAPSAHFLHCQTSHRPQRCVRADSGRLHANGQGHPRALYGKVQPGWHGGPGRRFRTCTGTSTGNRVAMVPVSRRLYVSVSYSQQSSHLCTCRSLLR